MEPLDRGPAARHWYELVEGRRAQMDAAYGGLGRTSADYWTHRITGRPSLLRRAATADDPLLQHLRSRVNHATTVLDVGAGAGRYSLALAPLVASIIAVEPDAAMVPLLEESLRNGGIGNVEVRQVHWQDAILESSDVVLCAHVLYPIVDAAPFIEKLQAPARRGCFIALRDVVSEPDPLGALWQRFHGAPRFLQPGYVDAFNLLYELGIHANVHVHGVPGQTWSFESLAGAVAAVREHLIVPEDAAITAEIQAALESALVPDSPLLTLPTAETQLGILWWETKV